MRSDERRAGRVSDLYKTALTGKYTWEQLLSMARDVGVSESTAKSYVNDVYNKLKQRGLLK